MTTRIAKRAVCALIAAFLLTANLSGCGNNNVPTQTDNDMTAVQTTAPTGKITVYAPDGRQDGIAPRHSSGNLPICILLHPLRTGIL